MMLHAAMQNGHSIKPEHWTRAMDYAVWIYNRIPHMDTGISPLEMWSRSCYQSTSEVLVNCHTWGCPVFILEPKLCKSGVKIPKWAPRSGHGVVMGFSKFHSSLIGLVLNKPTGSISPQFHVVFDDGFTIVPSPEGGISQDLWLKIITLPMARLQSHLDQEDDPDLSSKWLDPQEQAIRDHDQCVRAIKRTWTNLDPGEFTWRRSDPAPPILREAMTAAPTPDQDTFVNDHMHRPESPPKTHHVPLDKPPTLSSSPRQPMVLTPTGSPPRCSKWKHKAPTQYDPGIGSAWEWKSNHVANLTTTLEKGVWTACDWADITDYLEEQDAEHAMTAPCMGQEPTFTANAAKKRKAHDPDTPNYFEAMSGDSALKYYKAMQEEITNLEKRKTWEVVPCSTAGDKHVVPGT
jgi:hypothetical protein